MGLEADSVAGGPVFLQFGDLRLGAETDPRLRLPEENRRLRRTELLDVAAAACRLAVERKADFVLIPGDLLDGPVIGDADCDRLIGLLADLAPRPVIIAPGDRDAWSADSVWNSDLLSARGRRTWPENVHIFRTATFEAVRMKTLPDVIFVGRSHPAVECPEARLPTRIERPAAGYQVLLHHGSAASQRACRPVTQPFTDAELLSQGFTYAAIGHSARSYVIRDDQGRIRAGDAGPAAAVWPPASGIRGACVGRLTGQGVAEGGLETVPLDRRRLREVRVDLSGAASGVDIRSRMLEAAAESGAGPDDLVHVIACGLYAPEAELPPVSGWADLPYFHFQADFSAARPDYDLEALRGEARSRKTVERRFVTQMMERIEAAPDEADADLSEAALNCGLDALRYGRSGLRA